MQNKSQVGNTVAQIEQGARPPVPIDYGPTVSAVSALLSFFAIWISISTSVNSRRANRRSLFDSDFGTPLRAALRSLEQSVDELSAYIFPSAKDLNLLKNELQETQGKIEENTFGCARLIREIDTSTTVDHSGWEQSFLIQSVAARERLESLYSPTIVNLADFQGRADQVRADYRKLVAAARQQIEDIRRGRLKDRASG